MGKRMRSKGSGEEKRKKTEEKIKGSKKVHDEYTGRQEGRKETGQRRGRVKDKEGMTKE